MIYVTRHCHIFTPESTQAVSQGRLLGTFQLICLRSDIFTYIYIYIYVYIYGRDLYACLKGKIFPKPCNMECVALISVMLMFMFMFMFMFIGPCIIVIVEE